LRGSDDLSFWGEIWRAETDKFGPALKKKAAPNVLALSTVFLQFDKRLPYNLRLLEGLRGY
jgi:hypothetical protein